MPSAWVLISSNKGTRAPWRSRGFLGWGKEWTTCLGKCSKDKRKECAKETNEPTLREHPNAKAGTIWATM